MFNQLTVIGTGLLGASLARDCRTLGLAKKLVGVCRSPQTAEQALSLGVVDKIVRLQDAIKGADLIVLAIPMQGIAPIIDQIAELLDPKTILTDVGSVKTDLYQQVLHRQPQLLSRFVLAHPIAGGENSGVAASANGMFENKHLIITKTEQLEAHALTKVEALWAAVGAKVLTMSLEQHDAIFAKTSHLPHVIAFTLVNYLRQQDNHDQLFDLAAAGFYDFTRIASSNAEMWRDICITNRDQLITVIDEFGEQLKQIRKHINYSDQQNIFDYFEAAKKARDTGIMKK